MGKKLKAALELAQRSSREVGIALVTSAPVLAFAQPTDPFDGVMTNAETKVGTYMEALGVLAGIAVVFWIGIKYIKKIRGVA